MFFSWDWIAVAGFDILVYALSQIEHIWEGGAHCFRRVQELALSRMPYDSELPV